MIISGRLLRVCYIWIRIKNSLTLLRLQSTTGCTRVDSKFRAQVTVVGTALESIAAWTRRAVCFFGCRRADFCEPAIRETVQRPSQRVERGNATLEIQNTGDFVRSRDLSGRPSIGISVGIIDRFSPESPVPAVWLEKTDDGRVHNSLVITGPLVREMIGTCERRVSERTTRCLNGYGIVGRLFAIIWCEFTTRWRLRSPDISRRRRTKLCKRQNRRNHALPGTGLTCRTT